LQRLASQPHLVDLSHIEGLNGIEMKRRSLVIGATAKQASIQAWISRATEIVLIDLPLWVHFALAAERQVLASRRYASCRNGGEASHDGAIQDDWGVDQNWLPAIRELCGKTALTKRLTRLCSLEEIDA
jgi:FAD binding domain in molybdopterin dehydrogenase